MALRYSCFEPFWLFVSQKLCSLRQTARGNRQRHGWQGLHGQREFRCARLRTLPYPDQLRACYWNSKITQKQEGNVLDLWTLFDADSDKAKGAMTEYSMDWTVNVASHEFRSAETLKSSNEVCSACHIGYYQGDKSKPALGLAGIGIRRHPQTQELALSAARGVHETMQLCTACHTDTHEMVLKNTEMGGRTGSTLTCATCHADKAMAGENHKTVTCAACHDAELGVHLDGGLVVPMALKHSVEESWPSHNLTTDVLCAKCHVAGNTVGASTQVTPGPIHSKP